MRREKLLLACGVCLLEQKLALGIRGLLQKRLPFSGGGSLLQMLLRRARRGELKLVLVVRLRGALQEQMMRGCGRAGL